MYIEKINGPADVKKLTLEELPVLAEEIRQALLVRAPARFQAPDTRSPW